MSERTDSTPEISENGDPASPDRPRPARSRGAAAAADRVGTIVAAAEQAAEDLRLRTEARMRERISEGERAAQNRIRSAEEEAIDIVKSAREEAERAKTLAASEALGILAKAHADADKTRKEAEVAVTASTSKALTVVANAQGEADAITAKAKAGSREVLGVARVAAADVRSEGLELVQNLREMGNSLRSNAELLLGDIQAIHARMVAELDRVDGGTSRSPAPRPSRRDPGSAPRARDGARPPRDTMFDGQAEGDDLDVPEFIPPG